MKPTRGKVLVRRLIDTQTTSGLFLPETQKQSRVFKGEVISVGDCYQDTRGKLKHAPCNTGDTVFFKDNWQKVVLDEHGECYFPTFESIISVIRNETD